MFGSQSILHAFEITTKKLKYSSKIIPNFIPTECSCAGKSNSYGDGSECKVYSGYDDGWQDGRWCYADVVTCPDAKEHAIDYGQGPGYGASKAACSTGKYKDISGLKRGM